MAHINTLSYLFVKHMRSPRLPEIKDIFCDGDAIYEVFTPPLSHQTVLDNNDYSASRARCQTGENENKLCKIAVIFIDI